MNLTVDIKRLVTGNLEACVVQNGKRGINLLSSRTKKVVNARTIVSTRLNGHTITWTGCHPDEDYTSAEDKKVSTPRDEYGMGGVRG